MCCSTGGEQGSDHSALYLIGPSVAGNTYHHGGFQVLINTLILIVHMW